MSNLYFIQSSIIGLAKIGDVVDYTEKVILIWLIYCVALSVVNVGKVKTNDGCWMKLTEQSLAKYCDKPTNQGYVLCDDNGTILIEPVEVCVYIII